MNMKIDKKQGQCLCESTDILIFSCPRGANVGQMTNEVAKGLTARGLGNMYCLAGIGGHVNGIIESIKAAKKIVAIDGCSVKCAKKILEHMGFFSDLHVICTELGVKKNYSFFVSSDDVKKIMNQITEGFE
jgi:uncharacterized metal-binding protein